jgi:hypothetical protein
VGTVRYRALRSSFPRLAKALNDVLYTSLEVGR